MENDYKHRIADLQKEIAKQNRWIGRGQPQDVSRQQHVGAIAQATLMTVLHGAPKRSAITITLVVDALRNPAAVHQLL